MIPRQMEHFLRSRLPDRTFENRLIRDGHRRYLEFNTLDVDQLARLDITVDNLGPRLVVCMWDEGVELEIGGYLVVDNLAMGRPSMGGIRMLPDVTPAAVYNLARGMTLKNAAAQLPYGGGKAGIVADPHTSAATHETIVRGFAHLIRRYISIYLPGPDVGTNDADMKTVAIVNGLDNALSKPVDMGGNRIDELGAAAAGTIIALEQLIEELPRLRGLPQCASLQVPAAGDVDVLIQGFGAVGAHGARLLQERLPGARVTGVSDVLGYLYDAAGLPVEQLFAMWQRQGEVTRPYYQQHLRERRGSRESKYSTAPDDLLRESAFCFIPAAPIANYLDTDPGSGPSMTVDRMGDWSLIVEGANTYSPDPARKAARARMERAVYRQKGVVIATDYLVNSGGVIYAAQEHLIKTPDALRIPDGMLGDREAVDGWLAEHAAALAELAAQRLEAAQQTCDQVIRANMRELVDLLLEDADMLPGEAAERISVRRIARRESDRTVADIMDPLPTTSQACTVQDAAHLLVTSNSTILAVLDEQERLAGVATEWDITQATARDLPNDTPLAEIMTTEVITACADDRFLDVIRRLEHHSISAMPVMDDDRVLGKISANLLARRSLLRLLQAEAE
ncbi:MAG: Glu/Leu/Phe/Val dehydrogenase dimerization domain-containing protein [Candidatus Promineifilaceae bacterium]|nr:Glu/Leu/Phe/Val dehydrogenase dimerization domain-containing protein [Candidatus Promineifilaceae bacterium]